MNNSPIETVERLTTKINRLHEHIKKPNHRDYSARKALENAVNLRAKKIRQQGEKKGGAE